MSKHSIRAIVPNPTEPDSEGMEVEITFHFTRGRPAVMYLRNGDPGYPADPHEVEFISVRRIDQEIDLNLSQSALDDFAEQFLADDANQAEIMEAVESDMEAAREFAADLRADR